MQLKTTVRYHLTPVRMVIIKKSTSHACWRGCGEKGILLHCWWECILVQPLWRTVWRFFKKLKILRTATKSNPHSPQLERNPPRSNEDPTQPKKKKNQKNQLKLELPYDPTIPLLDLYLEKTLTRKDTCTPMFIAALCTIAKTWKQPKCPSTDEWIKKMWYIYTMEYYSAIRKNEILPFTPTSMDLEIIILSEQSRKEGDKYHMISLICGT